MVQMSLTHIVETLADEDTNLVPTDEDIPVNKWVSQSDRACELVVNLSLIKSFTSLWDRSTER